MLQPDTYLVIAWSTPAPGARLDSEEPFVFPAPGEDWTGGDETEGQENGDDESGLDGSIIWLSQKRVPKIMSAYIKAEGYVRLYMIRPFSLSLFVPSAENRSP